jgi:hypothetical protein
MHPPLVYKTYQDVKNNLVYWTIVLLALSTFLVWNQLLTPQQQQTIAQSFSDLAATQVPAPAIWAVIAATYFVTAYLLSYIFQIHDVVYDGHVVHWRQSYDINFILPNLTEPFSKSLPQSFLRLASENRREFMDPYYAYVGDGKPGITDNARVRFYERVTIYWATQLNEIFLIVILLAVSVSVTVGDYPHPTRTLATLYLLLLLLFLANRVILRFSLRSVSKATMDEIKEILDKPQNIHDLTATYQKLCLDHGISP